MTTRDVSIVVASQNARPYVERALVRLTGVGREVILVDCASTDGTAAFVRDRFPEVRLVELDVNLGYGGALNEGARLASGTHLLLMNADAWPSEPDSIDLLVAFADDQPSAGAVGPRLLNPDGSLQRSVRGFPTLWRLSTEYFFLRWLNPRSRALNAFYGAGFDHGSVIDAEFLVGAVLLTRRQAFGEIGGFDPSFFMFNEEVDLCYRLRQAGWRVVFYPGASFVHLGGASTRLDWSRMYREQLRSHLRFVGKHHGSRQAEHARRLLLWSMRLRTLVFRGERRRLSRDAARWLAADDAAGLLDRPA
ncbi:MAG TPA: glycosyltransferase family 2 protein [Gaiellaceae bacterium]|nr:glycosyltransferase family 2 protein [Gaiellaceae bacterium]